jgi:hypothetical protein
MLFKYLVFALTMLHTLQSAPIYNSTAASPHNSTLIETITTTTTTMTAKTTTTTTSNLPPINGSLQNPRLDTTDFQNSYVQHDKFYVNSNQEVPIKTHATTPLSLIVILISLVAAAFIIAGIMTALFVMKRRFSILRINGAKCGAGNDGNGASDTTNEPEAISEKEKEVLAAAAVAAAAATVVEIPEQESPKDEVKGEEEVPVSSTVKAVAVEDGGNGHVVAEEAAKNVDANESASTSLIANVLSDLSESVALKLQSMDADKQPLN